MTNPSKAKGDRAELEIAGLLADQLGLPVRRKLGAGRSDAVDSSNGSELYVVIGQAPRGLDLNITVVGRVLKGMVPSIALIFLVLGTIFMGLATPTEAGAMGAVGAVLLAVMNRTFTWKLLREAMGNTMRLTSMVIFILIGATDVPFRKAMAEVTFGMLRDAEPSLSAAAALAHPYFSGGAPCTILIDEVEALWARGYNPWDLYNADEELRADTERFSREQEGFEPYPEWRKRFAQVAGGDGLAGKHRRGSCASGCAERR